MQQGNREGMKRAKILGILFALAFAILIVWFGSRLKATLFPPRQPSKEENFFYAAAFDFDAPQLCGKIGKEAGETAGFARLGYQIEYFRSECYQEIALKTKDRSLCDRVISISTLFLDGSGISPKACLKEITENKKPTNPIVPPPLELPQILDRLGYTQQVLAHKLHGVDPVLGLYNRIKRDPSFIAKLKSGPDYSEKRDRRRLRPQNELEVLYEDAALESSDPSLCEKISPNAYCALSSKNPRGFQVIAPRSDCFYGLALNSQNPSWCKRVYPISTPQLDGSGYDANRCREQMKKLTANIKRGGSYQKWSRSCYISNEVIGKALAELGYTPPLPKADREDYLHFYSYLLYESSPSERSKLVKKIEAMPGRN
jgi:hypothetical protein